MPRPLVITALLVSALAGAACRPRATASPATPAATAGATASAAVTTLMRETMESADASVVAEPAKPEATPREIGPYEVPFLGKRNVYYVVPSSREAPRPLIANLHGLCNPPGYACGYWSHAASDIGFLVCPAGNSTCGPGTHNAPTWSEPYEKMGEDLEVAIRTVEDAYPGEISRENAVLTGFSLGAYAAPVVAARHPGRWRYLILNEANVELSALKLRQAGVRAVALIAGELGSQVAGERKTCDALARQGYPARLWVMPKAGHYYSANIDGIMAEALAFVLSHEHDQTSESKSNETASVPAP